MTHSRRCVEAKSHIDLTRLGRSNHAGAVNPLNLRHFGAEPKRESVK